MSELHHLSIRELSEGLQQKQFSATELTQHFNHRIQSLDPKVNSFVTQTSEQALAAAAQSDQSRQQGDIDTSQRLAGIPLAHKDLFCTKGVLTTAGSKMLANFVSPYDATIVKSCQQAGLIMLGKLNMDEFAMGSDNKSSYFGHVHNPWNLDHVPGGSSGGSAAAVAAGLIPFATASDTGGSIRQPASFCGLTGIKPTYGRVSRFGMIAYASSLDQAGVIAHSSEDCAYLLATLSGHDPKDSTSINRATEDYVAILQDNHANAPTDKPLQGIRIGIAEEYFADGLDKEVKAGVEAALEQYKQLGASIVEIHITEPRSAIAAYYLLAPAEASSNLSRFDGVRYGYRCDNPRDLTDMYKRSRAEGFGNEVQRRIMIGTYALSAGYFDAFYIKAQKVRRLIANDFAKAFEQCDVIASPTAPTAAYAFSDKQDPVSMYLGDVYTIAVNLAGLPALSHQVGFNESGLPIGIQLIGNYWQESQLLHLAHQYQQVTDYHQQRSPIAQ